MSRAEKPPLDLADEIEEAMFGWGVRVEARNHIAVAAVRIVRERVERALGCNHRFDPGCARCVWLEPVKEALEALGLLEPLHQETAGES